MNVAQIANGFIKNRLYENLFHHLDEMNVAQQIYSPVRNAREEGYTINKKFTYSDIYISNVIKPYHRILYRLKLKTIYLDFLIKCSVDKLDLIHAHTLYSDGGVAMKLKKNLGIPFMVAVRSTDIIIFEKYRPDLKSYRNRILSESEKIVFISPTLKENFLKLLNKEERKTVRDKTEIIPNGIDFAYFSNDQNSLESEDIHTIKILYVGNFRKLKNVPVLIEAVRIVNETKRANLTIVGGGGRDEKRVMTMAKSDKYSFINYLGTVNKPVALKKLYLQSDIFAMVSKPETFGLVYIEALSQGTPIIYTQGEGVDGFFESNTVGESVNNFYDPEEIARKILQLSERLGNELSRVCIKKAKRYNWTSIANDYRNIYSDIIHS